MARVNDGLHGKDKSMLRLKRNVSWKVDEDGLNQFLDDLHGHILDFPSDVPYMDVFGPYGNSRKQRGWFHVQRWSLVPPTGENEQHQYATGADVPQELFDLILEQCDCRYNSWDDVQYSKQDVKSLRLVCRRWAELCTDRLFEQVTLRRRRDMTDLVSLLDKRPSLCKAFRSVKLELDLSVAAHPYDRPWVDAFCRKIAPQMLNVCPHLWGVVQTDAFQADIFEEQISEEDIEWATISLDICGPLPAGRTLNSIHSTSPSRCPWHPLPITELRLRDVHLKTFSHLVRVLRELPLLESVFGTNVTWDAPADGLRLFPRVSSYIPCPNRPPVFYSFDCPESSLETGVWLATVLAPSRASQLRQSDADTLCGIILNTFGAICNAARSQSRDIPVGWRATARKDGSHIALDSLGSIHMITTLAPRGPNDNICRVLTVCLDFSFEQSAEKVAAVSWAAVDNLVASMETLQYLELIFGSWEDVVSFRENVALASMPHLRESSKIRYKPAYHPTGDWKSRENMEFLRAIADVV